MANIKNIEIVINKEMAKEAYEAGARWAFDDEDGILTIEGFEEYWNKMKREGNTVDTGSGQSNIPDVIVRFRAVAKAMEEMQPNGFGRYELLNAITELGNVLGEETSL